MAITLEDEIREFMCWSPPAVRTDLIPETSTSGQSRKRPFYDNHLLDSLTLKRIVRLPSLTTDIARKVDYVLRLARTNNFMPPPYTHIELLSEEAREVRDFEQSEPLKNEASVAVFYHRTTAAYCIHLASHLTTRVPRYHPFSVLKWDSVSNTSHLALVDGVLRFSQYFAVLLLADKADVKSNPFLEVIHALMGRERKEDLRQVAEHFVNFLTWEFKSPSITSDISKHIDKLIDDGSFDCVRCPGL
ncbi:hypothetical protein BKA93DRAFT_825772 [Sparassis latifolia]|uniref:Uncharacterized protein n=1 Tax=Sparassis crispa TaxID=139825 RepID=A0A401GXS3_9APHY|nr:hypothetical protein SCP_0904730 [Sparassis crispa]GBE86594.1 hypothetical protein SCP_0904730 [Sparassis crispa]